jgi:hypothetical protein
MGTFVDYQPMPKGKGITNIKARLTYVVATQNTGTAITTGTTRKGTGGPNTTANGGGRRGRCWMNRNNFYKCNMKKKMINARFPADANAVVNDKFPA